MLKIKPELITIIDDKKEKAQSWEAHLSHNDSFYNGSSQLELVGYGDCEEEARDNLNVIFEKLFMAIMDQPTIEDLVAGITPDKDPHGEVDWYPDVGLEIID